MAKENGGTSGGTNNSSDYRGLSMHRLVSVQGLDLIPECGAQRSRHYCDADRDCHPRYKIAAPDRFRSQKHPIIMS